MKQKSAFLDRTAFEQRFGNLYRQIFLAHEPRRGSFVNSAWAFAIGPRDFLRNRQKFAEFCDAIEEIGDEELIVTEIESTTGNSVSFVASLDYGAFDEAMFSERAGGLVGLRKALFGRSAQWGAIVDEGTAFITGYAIFGGTPNFIERWIQNRGGREAMRAEFLKSLDLPNGWPQMPDNARIELLSEIGW